MLPELRRANTEIRVDIGLVPEHAVGQIRRVARIVNDETLKVLCTLVHNLAEEFKGWKGGGVVVVDTAAIVQIRLTQNKDKIHVRAQGWLDTERILHCNDEEALQPATVHEEVANIFVMCPGVIIHTVIQNHKGTGVQARAPTARLVLLNPGHDHLLPLHEVVQNYRCILAMNKNGRNHFSVEGVGLLCAADDSPHRHVLVVKEEVTYQRGFASATATNENYYGVLGHLLHVEALDVEIHGRTSHFCLLERIEKNLRFLLSSLFFGRSRMDGLRGVKIPTPYFRTAPLSPDLLKVEGYRNLQTYFPTLTKLFRLSRWISGEEIWMDTRWRVVGLDCSGTAGPCSLRVRPNSEEAAPVEPQEAFLKVTHLLDPIQWIRGRYSLPKEAALPWFHKGWLRAWQKLQDPGNQAYVEAIAAYALGRLREENVSPHFNLFYGAFCARANKYRYNLSQDFQSYRHERWFWRGQQRSLFALRIVGEDGQLQDLPEEALRDFMDAMDSEGEESSSESGDSIGAEELGGEAEPEDESDGSLHSADSMSDVSYAEENSGDDDNDEDDGADADCNFGIFAEMADYPVMLILSEKNDGTMDALFDEPEEGMPEPGTEAWEARWTAWLFQVIAALSCAQSIIGFTHNDLHTNNIVWKTTDQEFLYYKNRSGSVFRVPTYGKIFRIIDFGRAIFTINGHRFISDDFKNGNEADGQYAFEPLVSRPKKVVPPNPSFDLARLAVSLLDGIFPETPAAARGSAAAILSDEPGLRVEKTVSPLYNMVWTWMIDDDGANIFINPDGSERFPDFDLYKHIAAACHRAVPSQQIHNETFDGFQVSAAQVPAEQKLYSLFC